MSDQENMTTYGTIPTSSEPGASENPHYISGAKERIEEVAGARRPWNLMLHIGFINFPGSLSEALSRMITNVAYFRMNYAIIVLLILFLNLLWYPDSLIVFIVVMMGAWFFWYFRMKYAIIVLLIPFLSLLWHPISLIIFLFMMAAWFFLYSLRGEALVVFNRAVGDSVVLIVLAILTIVLLLLTHAIPNILLSLLIGAIVILVHASLRRTDELHDEESAVAERFVEEDLRRADDLHDEESAVGARFVEED